MQRAFAANCCGDKDAGLTLWKDIMTLACCKPLLQKSEQDIGTANVPTAAAVIAAFAAAAA